MRLPARLGIAALALAALHACSPAAVWVKPRTQVLTCENYALVEADGHAFYNNVWNANAAEGYEWQQCIEQEIGGAQRMGWSWDWPQDDTNTIFSYPQARFGISPWDPARIEGQVLPARLSELNSLRISHAIEADASGPFNIATSFWLTEAAILAPDPAPEAIRAEVMVWTYYTTDHMRPAGRNVGAVVADGVSYDIWLDENWGDVSGAQTNQWLYLAFKQSSPSFSANFDVTKLLRSPLLAQYGLEELYIADAEIGSEVAGGKGLIWVNSVSIDPDN